MYLSWFAPITSALLFTSVLSRPVLRCCLLYITPALLFLNPVIALVLFLELPYPTALPCPVLTRLTLPRLPPVAPGAAGGVGARQRHRDRARGRPARPARRQRGERHPGRHGGGSADRHRSRVRVRRGGSARRHGLEGHRPGYLLLCTARHTGR